jgi:predicted O-methyltransferase YrrM
MAGGFPERPVRAVGFCIADRQEDAVKIDQRTHSYYQQLAGPEDEPLRAARARSEEADIPAVPAETGGLLRWLAGVRPARAVAEIGSGGGYSGLWLLSGMDPRGILTTIEVDRDNQALAQQAYSEAGQAARVRSILGPALSVLPKLADEAYDLVFIDAVKAEYPDYLPHARRMLRPGGLLVADNAFLNGRVADPDDDSDSAQGIRTFTDMVREDAALHSQVLPVGDGVVAAVYHP